MRLFGTVKNKVALPCPASCTAALGRLFRLQALLARLRLDKFTEDLKSLGVETKADLAYLEAGLRSSLLGNVSQLSLPGRGPRKARFAFGRPQEIVGGEIVTLNCNVRVC